MHIIKLNAINSTNSYLRKLSAKEGVEDFTVVVAKHQTHGRGQMGTVWNSESSKNLTFSVFKDVSKLPTQHAFYISMVVSLSLIKALQCFSIPKLSIKWPNDILSEDKKISGILIENVIKQSNLQASIIGIGLNINQTEFLDLPRASSLKILTGKTFDLDEVLQLVLRHLKDCFKLLKSGEYQKLKDEYETFIFRKDKPSTFQDAEGAMFSGFIKNVSESGNLQVLLEDNIVMEFGLKDVTLLY